MRRILSFLAASAALWWLPAADAARVATPEEAASTIAAAGGDPRCSSSVVSSVDPAWAVVSVGTASRPGGECTSFSGAVVRLQDGAWRALGPGPSRCALRAIPESVGRDLRICTAPPALVQALLPRVGGLAQDRPREIAYGPGADDLVSIRWARWGKASATGAGAYDFPADDGFVRVRFRVRMDRVKRCSTGTRIFTRVSIRAVRAGDRRLLPSALRSLRVGPCATDRSYDIR